MKKKYQRFRELWAVPKYKLLIKFGLWAILFSFIFIMSAFSNPSGHQSNDVVKNPTYNAMKLNLTEKSLQIKYIINDFIIEGNLIDDTIEGTIESKNGKIEKIKIDPEHVYLKEKNELVKSTVLNEINLLYLFPKYIINIINENTSLMRQSEDQKIYLYNINNKSYSVYIDEEAIIKIVILDGITTYELEYKIIN